MKKLINFFMHPTSKDIIINTIGNYMNVGFTALFALLLVRILNPSQYGVMSVLLGISYVLANVLDFGTTATIYSYLPALYQAKSHGLYRFMKSTFYYQSLFSFIVIIILFITFPFLDEYFFKTHAPIWELYLTTISVMLFIWQNTVLNFLYAAKKFILANMYLNVANLIKTVFILYLTWMHMISVGSIIFVFGVLGPCLFFSLLFWRKRELFFIVKKAEVSRDEFRFSYTLTYFLAAQFQNLGMRMDLFLLSFFGLKNDVGYYGLSQKIILTVISTVVSITQVLSPGFAAIHKKNEILPLLKKSILYMLIPTALFVIVFLLPDWVYSLIFTKKFGPTSHISRALSLPFIVYTLGSIPPLFVLYTIKKPIHSLVSNILFFVIVTVGCIVLIPKMKVFGPPYALLAAFIISTLYLVIISVVEYKKIKTTLR